MIIDFHTHLFPDKIASKAIAKLAEKSGSVPHTDGTVLGLLKQMQKGDCTIAVALPVVTDPAQFDSVNRFAATVNQDCRFKERKIISFGGIHPRNEDIAGKMRFLKESGFLGVKIHPDYQEAYIDDDGYVAILESAKELDMIVVTHAGVDSGYKDQPVRCTPERVKNVIERVGHTKFVLAHLGGHRYVEQVYDLLAGLDVYFDTSYVLPEVSEADFKRILNKHGEDKILFATDCPWQDIQKEKDRILSYKLEKETEEKILWRNAADLLGISGENYEL